MKSNAILLGIIGFVLASAGVSSAKIIRVNWDGSGDYTTIQDAIDDANDFDVVIVADGTYTGEGNRDIDFKGKAITVHSENGPENCIVNCQGVEFDYHSGFYFISGEDSNSVLDGFTIRNGYAKYVGGGIYCYESEAYIKNCIIEENKAYPNGGGILCWGSNVIVEDCVIRNNEAQEGAGICSYYNDELYVKNCLIENNGILEGGGGLYCCPGNLELSGSIIRNNLCQSFRGGGGATIRTCNVAISDCIFEGNVNTGSWGGGIYCTASSMEINNCTFVENSAYGEEQEGGGGIYCENTELTVTSSTFVGNEACYADGGGINASDSNLTLTSSAFVGNETCHADGGGIHASESNLTITDCEFDGNSANYGGGLYCTSPNLVTTSCIFSGNICDGYGGGLYFSGESATIRNCTFTSNESYRGGGGVSCRSDNATIEASIFRKNYTNGDHDYGGGGLFSVSDAAVIKNCTFIENSALYNDNGGGLFCGGYSVINNCVFRSNDAAKRGGGVGVLSDSSITVMTNCVFSGNKAEDGGGAALRGSNPTITNCVFNGNFADYRGGALDCSNSNPMITNCIMWDNTPEQIHPDNSSIPIVSYCDIQDGWEGEGNIDVNPMFVEAGYWDPNSTPNNQTDDFWIDGDYHLLPWSPCVDRGTNTPNGGLDEYDLDGNPRIVDGDSDSIAMVDMGAYEMQQTPPEPIIKLSKYELTFTSLEGSEDYIEGIFTIRNAFVGTLNWKITEECDWLSVNPDSGESTGEEDEVTVSIDVADVEVGEYSCELTVTSPDAANSPQSIVVVLKITSLLYVPSEYPTIQAAIDSAVDGDVIIVSDGVYTGEGNIDISYTGKAITVSSENGPENCIIDCEGVGRGFIFTYDHNKDSTLEGFTITNGYAESGGGIYCDEGRPTIINCVFNNNSSSSSGGGLYCIESRPKLINCYFVDNSAARYGGAMFQGSSSPEVKDCIFTFNYAGTFGGGIDSSSCSNHNITNCTFSNNYSDYSGGGLYFHGSDSTIANCSFISNTSSGGGGGIFFNNYSDAKLTNCIFSDNYASAGGAISCSRSYPTITNCTLKNNNAANRGGGIHNYISDPTIMNSTLIENSSVDEGGGLYSYNSNPVIMNSILIQNSSVNEGGGLFFRKSNPTITNCTFFNNESGTGGCLYNYDNSNAVMTSCIMQADIPEEIVLSYYSSVSVNYCNITGGWEGEGNIDIEPLFVDSANGDYHLMWSSPCVDAGDPNYVAEEGEVDIDGEPRVMAGRVDIGADEVGPKQADFTRDGRIDVADLTVLGGSWGTQEGELNWYVLCDLWEDGIIGLDDLVMFAEDWLCAAEWRQ